MFQSRDYLAVLRHTRSRSALPAEPPQPLGLPQQGCRLPPPAPPIDNEAITQDCFLTPDLDHRNAIDLVHHLRSLRNPAWPRRRRRGASRRPWSADDQERHHDDDDLLSQHPQQHASMEGCTTGCSCQGRSSPRRRICSPRSCEENDWIFY